MEWEMRTIATRNDFPKLLKEFGLIRTAVEVGVAEGGFSYHLLDNWPGVCWQVDPWALLSEDGFSGHGEDTADGMEKRFRRIVQNSLTKYIGRAKPIRATSEVAAVMFPDAHFDFCYIDSNHSPKSARRDIALWWPKVKPGSILGGHDYLEGIRNGQEYGVKLAVIEFAAENNLSVNVTQENDWPSWWVRKPL